MQVIKTLCNKEKVLSDFMFLSTISHNIFLYIYIYIIYYIIYHILYYISYYISFIYLIYLIYYIYLYYIICIFIYIIFFIYIYIYVYNIFQGEIWNWKIFWLMRIKIILPRVTASTALQNLHISSIYDVR